MKVVINVCFGGFGLTDEAAAECIRRGMTVSGMDGKGRTIDKTADFLDMGVPTWGTKYYAHRRADNGFRSNPILVAVVEEFLATGKNPAGSCGKLEVVEIPFDTTEGWGISEYDGNEHVEELHRTWR